MSFLASSCIAFGVTFGIVFHIPCKHACCYHTVFVSLSRQRDKSKQTDGSPLALFNFFVERTREMLHIVLAMSPIGDAFRNRLRKFPSLVNCCTIDWFQVSCFLIKVRK